MRINIVVTAIIMVIIFQLLTYVDSKMKRDVVVVSNKVIGDVTCTDNDGCSFVYEEADGTRYNGRSYGPVSNSGIVYRECWTEKAGRYCDGRFQ